MTPSITYVAVYSDVHGAVTIASTLPPDTLDRRRLTSGEVLVQGFLQFAAKNGISTTANARHVSALQAALNLSGFDDKGQVPAAQAAPEGWVLVPAKPTREWIGAVADDGYADCDVAQMIASILSHAPAAPATVTGPVVAYRISDPNAPDMGHWLSDEPGAAWCKSEPLVAAPTAQPAPQPAPAQQGNALTEAAHDVLMEVARATNKFPTWPTDPLHALAVLGEEFGELTKDMLQLTYEPHKTNAENVRNEAVQTAAMALRLFISLDRYEYRVSAQHSQGADRAHAEEGVSA
mgnify:CR=1 FL=1